MRERRRMEPPPEAVEKKNFVVSVYKYMILVSIMAVFISLILSAIAGYPDSPDSDDYDDYQEYEDAYESYMDSQRILLVSLGLFRSTAAILLGFGLIFGGLFDKEVSDPVRIGMLIGGGLIMAFFFTGIRVEDFFGALY